MPVQIIRSSFGDNFFTLLHAPDGGDAVLIDPVDADAAMARVRALGARVKLILNTHSHYDHTAGNKACAEATGAPIAAHPAARGVIPDVALWLNEGDHVDIGGERAEVLFTPGHTLDHISLIYGDHLICGDTVFVGGAGNCRFGGDPHVLFRTFNRLAALPGHLLLYPGHDYSVRNLEFCLDLEPGNRAAAAKLDEARLASSDQLVQATLGEERAWSPFFRAGDPDLQAHLRQHRPEAWDAATGDSDAERAFVAVRAMRNTW